MEMCIRDRENTINQLDAEDCLRHINGSLYGNDYEERLFNVAMELCITWMNRILFLKLLEAQMLKYHNGDAIYKFFIEDNCTPPVWYPFIETFI